MNRQATAPLRWRSMGDADRLSWDYSDQIAELVRAGLSEPEARLVAEHRLAQVPASSASPKHLNASPQHLLEPVAAAQSQPKWVSLAVALGLALVSGLLVRLIFNQLLRGEVRIGEEAMIANLFFATLPLIGIYFAWMRRIPWKATWWAIAAVALLALAVNLYPLLPGYQTVNNYMTGEAQAQTGVLTALHLPVVLWLLVGAVFAATSGWHSNAGRLDFIRFTGEWVVFLILTWLVGGAITGIVIAAVNIAGINWWANDGFISIIATLVPIWLFLSVWLAEQTRTIVTRVLSILTWVFTPLMTLALIIVFWVLASSGSLIRADRDLLILLDGVLVLVLALALYSISARNPADPPQTFDWLQFVMIALAVLMNLFALIWMFVRLAEFGWTANRAAALGLNLVLMGNLVWTAWLLLKFLRSNLAFARIIKWQTSYLPIYAIWAGLVVLVFPLIFSVRW